MTAFILALFFLPQELPTQIGNGTVTGMVRDAVGTPQEGVRVAAMAVPGANGTDNRADVLVSISRTDEAGRYHLQVPQGRYYVIMGRVEKPTYFPGVGEMKEATVISITRIVRRQHRR